MTKEDIMKKIVLIVMALVAMQISAQEQKQERQGRYNQERYQKFKDFTPEQVAEIKTKKMALKLDLNEAQQRDIEKIHLANAKERKAKMEAHKKMRKSNIGEKLSKDEHYNFMNERLDKQISNKKEMKAILSKEQFEKFEKGMNHKRKKSQAHRQKNDGHKKQGRKKS